MKKWLDKYKEAENGIEGTMGGLTDQGFDYNGAWGGTMQMGGNLPGSVGFMYARTQGAAPSNGPYAKKTKASAQNGRAISDNTRLKPIVTEKPINREVVKSTEIESSVMSPQEALLNKLKGVKLKESQDRLNKTAEKLTAIGSLSPNPYISIPSAIGNFTLGATGTATPEDRGLDYMGIFGALATPDYASGFKKVSRRVPFFKGLSFVDALADIFEFTPSEDLPKRQNGGEMKFYQEGLDFKPKNISQDGTYVKKPRTDMSTMDEYRLQKALAEQPVIQSPKGKQLSKEEINKRNKEYAQQTGKKFDEKTGKVSSRFSPQEEKTLDRITENIVMPALAVGDVMGGMAIGAPLIKGAGKAALKKLPNTLKRLPTIPREPIPSPKGGMVMGQPVRPSTTMFGMSTEEFDRTVAELAARDRLNPADPSVRIRTLSEFDSRLEDYARDNQINFSDVSSGIEARFDDIARQYGLDITDYNRQSAIRNLSEENKEGFLTSFYQAIPSRLRRSDFVPSVPRSGTGQIKNRSGLTKEEALQKASEKDKDVVSKMTEDEFINTVVKPTGEVAHFYSGDVMSKFADKQAITKLPVEEYVNTFNANINVLNDIIAKRNKSGVDYAVKELDPYGKLTFTSPVGESSWSLGINPGKWEGDVEDIASPYYLKSIPGLEMRNTTAGVFADRTPRRGTGTYESINEYLKQIGLGRVKPGFNSQTVYSRGLWEDAVKKGKAVGYYNDPSTVYGSMKGLLPYAGLGALGAGAIEQKKKGGEIKKDDMGYWNPENWGEPVEIGSNQITMEGVYEPLIGVSDTGDVQYMEPGEEYEFDGESVTEYPVMQKGGRAPIYVDNPKDPRLKAYTDSLNLYKAMQMQDKLMGPNYKNDNTQKSYAPKLSDFTIKQLKEARKKKIIPKLEDLGPISDDFQNQKEMFSDTYFVTDNDKKLVNYYKSLGFTDDNIMYHSSADVVHPTIRPIDAYHDGVAWSPVYKKPVQPVQYKKAEPKKEVNKQEVVKKEQPKPVERRQNVYEGSPVYSPGVGSGLPSALIGFANQKGDTTYIKPEDYERFAVPKYAKEYIETKKQKNGGWLDKYN